MKISKYLKLINKWASEDSNIQALILTGSLARQDDTADTLSDIDIEIISREPQLLITDSTWISKIGNLLTVLALNPDQDQLWATRLAIYSDGMKIDYTLAALSRIHTMVEEQRLDALYERGYRVLMDKNQVTSKLPGASGQFPVRQLPSQAIFHSAIEEFWFEAAHIPKYLARNELWLAKMRDWNMKQLLMQMLEWHAIASNPVAVDIWHNGAHLQSWIKPKIWHALHNAFGHFDAQSTRKAFKETTQIYSQLAHQVSKLTYQAEVPTTTRTRDY